MTKKLLFLFDTDPVASVFDTVVGYDGGADHIIGYGGVTKANVGALVDGCIYTRGPKEKQFTAIFVGGGDMTAGAANLKTDQQNNSLNQVHHLLLRDQKIRGHCQRLLF